MNITDLPFNKYLGIKKDGDNITLENREHLLNHVGSLHATVIYGLAEAASGDYIIENLMEQFPDALALARQGSIKYKRPATDDCTAVVEVDDAALQACIQSLNNRARATLTVPVQILSEEKPIAAAEFTWWFSLK